MWHRTCAYTHVSALLHKVQRVVSAGVAVQRNVQRSGRSQACCAQRRHAAPARWQTTLTDKISSGEERSTEIEGEPPLPRRERKFVDRARLVAVGGRGGKGIVSFESITNIKKRPMGGNGGRGGDVIVCASATVRDLYLPLAVVRGRAGGDASGKGKGGRNARPLKIMVPVGTVVKELHKDYIFEDDASLVGLRADADEELSQEERDNDAEEEQEDEDTLDGGGDDGDADAEHGAEAGAAEDGLSDTHTHTHANGKEQVRTRVSKSGVTYTERLHVLADLVENGQSLLVARGGSPGLGNKGSVLTYAETVGGANKGKPHTRGQPGEMRVLELELKSIADVGLVGFPNAGKSSLLGALSKAKPKVADYPFTTLHPTIGVVHFADTAVITVADIPGLIEGAHADRGLGHDFLRHIERTSVLAYVLDVSGASDAIADLRTLQQELHLYSPDLPLRPSIVIANKIDAEGSAERISQLRANTSLPVVTASALHKQNIGQVASALRWLLEALRQQNEHAAAGST